METRHLRPMRRSASVVREWFHVSHASIRHVLWLVGPLALQVILFKAVKFAVLSERTLAALDVGEQIGRLLVENLGIPIAALVIASVVALIVKRPGVPWTIATFAFLVFFGVAGYGIGTVMQSGIYWLSLDFLSIIRFDLVELLILASIALICLEHTRGPYRISVLVVLHVLVPTLMMLGILELGYFLETGSIADAFMLRYTFTNLSDLSYVLSSELTGYKLVLLSLPLLLSLFPFVADRIDRNRRSPKHRFMLPISVASALLLVVLPNANASNRAGPVLAGTYEGLLEGFFNRPVWDNEEVTAMEKGSAPVFDTKVLRAVPKRDPSMMNVVFIILESQRSPENLPPGVTPFIDSLASRSMAVEHMFAVIPHTNKALVPILCGVYPSINQGEEPDVPGNCLPRLLKPFGYRSAFFTPATLAFEQKGEMLHNMGFDDAFGDDEIGTKGFAWANYFGREERVMLKPSLDWVDQRLETKTPFFLTYLTLTPHHPYWVPKRHGLKNFGVANEAYTKYLNALSFVDGFIRELFGEFRARGMIDNTLFVIFADHGEAFGEHKLQFHSAVPYDEALHIPAMLYNPVLFDKPGHIGGIRQQTDLLPTVLDILGYDLVDGFLPGSTLMEPAPPDRRLYHATWIENQSMALRLGPRKFVYHYRRLPMEVFDLDDDPGEQHNIASQYSAKELDAVELELLVWRRRVNEIYHR